MKKTFNIFLLLLIILFSCKEIGKDNEDKVEPKKLDLLIEKIEESDKDIHGCLASAGYTWSKLSNDCINLFDVTIHLTPKNNLKNENEILNAYLIFDDSNKAEIYLPNDIESKIFVREALGKPWIFEDWKLISSNGFILKKGEEILFVGDGERGAKITGSDKNED